MREQETVTSGGVVVPLVGTAASTTVPRWLVASEVTSALADSAEAIPTVGGAGRPVSMVTLNAAEAGDVAVPEPEGNDWVAVTAHVPSTRAGRSQAPVAPVAANVQLTEGEPARAAVTVTVAPSVSAPTSIVGVESALAPRSRASSRQ